MTKEQMIEEMADLIYDNRPIPQIWIEDATEIANTICAAGYRKQSEVAREIFATIETALLSAIEVNNATEHSENATTNKLVCTSKENAYLTTLCFLDKLKQKYGVE